jgi:hypothetical protein
MHRMESCHFTIQVGKEGGVKFGEKIKDRISLQVFRKAYSGAWQTG